MERKIDRFDKYMTFKGLNDNRVTIDLSLSVGTLGKSRKENRDLSDRNIEMILKYYDDLDGDWLLTGKGDMLKSDASLVSEPQGSYEKQNDDTLFFKKIIEAQQRTIDSQQQTIHLLQQTIEGFVQKDDTADTVRIAGAG
jgi:hypothetical protein